VCETVTAAAPPARTLLPLKNSLTRHARLRLRAKCFLSAFLGLMASSSLPLGDLYSDEWVPPEHATEEEIKELIADRNYEKHGRYATSRIENVGVVGVFWIL
jgi:hypothetical protein